MNYILIFSLATLVIFFAKSIINSNKGKNMLSSHNDTADEKYNAVKRLEKQEIDKILEKITVSGESSITQREKRLLDEYSAKS